MNDLENFPIKQSVYVPNGGAVNGSLGSHVESKVRSRWWFQDTGSYSSKDCQYIALNMNHAWFVFCLLMYTWCTHVFCMQVYIHSITFRYVTLRYVTLHYIHCMHAYMPTCIDAYMHTCIHTCMHTSIPTFLPTYLHTYTHTYTQYNTWIYSCLSKLLCVPWKSIRLITVSFLFGLPCFLKNRPKRFPGSLQRIRGLNGASMSWEEIVKFTSLIQPAMHHHNSRV